MKSQFSHNVLQREMIQGFKITNKKTQPSAHAVAGDPVCGI
jgi:hypothetical protein